MPQDAVSGVPVVEDEGKGLGATHHCSTLQIHNNMCVAWGVLLQLDQGQNEVHTAGGTAMRWYTKAPSMQ